MKESIGGVYMLNIILVFLVLIFAFLIGTISYYKAFKVNRRMQDSIETYEGYNSNAQAEIEQTLSLFGYKSGNEGCKAEYTRGVGASATTGYLVSGNNNGYVDAFGVSNILNNVSEESYDYCIYVFKDTTRNSGVDTNYYYSYGILTYMYLDFPIINKIVKIPIFTRSEKIYKFTTE